MRLLGITCHSFFYDVKASNLNNDKELVFSYMPQLDQRVPYPPLPSPDVNYRSDFVT